MPKQPKAVDEVERQQINQGGAREMGGPGQDGGQQQFGDDAERANRDDDDETVASSNASDLTDRRGGARDNIVPKPEAPMQEQRTPRQDTQGGADARPDTTPDDDSLPEGLRRERKDPYSPTRGRSEAVPEQVPQNFKPKG
jgi:hypothetical protein